MTLYFDMCALKRPFDDLSQLRIRDEAAAVFSLLKRIEKGSDSLTWSAALTFENNADPDEEVRAAIARWESHAGERAVLSAQTISRFHDLCSKGFPSLDAAHLAYAESVPCDVLLTCDDRFLRRARRTPALIRVANPLEYWNEVIHEPASD